MFMINQDTLNLEISQTGISFEESCLFVSLRVGDTCKILGVSIGFHFS